MHSTMLALKVSIFASVLTCFALGCGNAPPAAVEKPSASTAGTPNTIVEGDTSTKQLTPTTNGESGNTATSTPLATQPVQDRTKGSSKPTRPSLPTANAQPSDTAPAPTADQLARWKQPEFEPLQLLHRQKLEEISFVAHADVSRDEKWLVLGGEKLTLWEPMTDKPTTTLWAQKSSEESIKSFAVDRSGTWIAAGDNAGMVRLWNLNEQKEMVAKKLYANDVTQLAISDDGKEIATATYDNSVSVWDAATLKQKNKFEVNTNGLARLLYAGTGKLAVAGQSLTVWDTVSGKLEKTLLEKGYPASMARSVDLSLFAFADEDSVQFLTSSELSESGQLKGKFARNEILHLTSDGKFVWTANGSSIRGWDRATAKVVQQIDVSKPEVVALHWMGKFNLLRVITEDGAIRYWGTVTNGKAAGLKPMHPPIEFASSSEVPATAGELVAIVDLRSLPQPPESELTISEATMIQFDSRNPIDDTKSFYRYIFGQRGWKEMPVNIATPNYLSFSKQGFKVFVSISDSGAGKSSIYLASLGNVDLRKLPKLDLQGFRLSYEDESNVNYEVATDLLTIEVELLKKFAAAGWLPFARLNSSHSEEVDSRSLEFMRNATTLRVSIRSKEAEPSKYHVQYGAFVALNHLPVPGDCDYIECDAAGAPALVARTSLALEDCHRFFDQAMAKLGWLVAGVAKSEKDDKRWLIYFRNQHEVQIRITRDDEGGTWILVGEYAQKNSWQLAKKEASDRDDSKSAKPGIEAADIPIYKQADATSVQYDEQQQRVEIKIPKTSHIEIVDFYASELSKLGWKEEPNGIRDEDYAFVTFKKEKASVQVRVNSSSLGTTIGISDDGLLWTKPLPTAKQMISYESWLRMNNHPATLKRLDEYVKEMRSQSK